MNMQPVLVIDDDAGLCELVAEYLEPEGYKVEAVHDGETGVERALSGEHALCVLDIMLPGINGFEVLRRIRARSRLPVVMLTARGDDVDRIVGLEIGADDYLPKPFNPRELVARINAVLRRTRPDEREDEAAAARLTGVCLSARSPAALCSAAYFLGLSHPRCRRRGDDSNRPGNEVRFQPASVPSGLP